MIRFERVSLAYEGRTVLRGVTLHVPPGGRVALMGPSGCGKTSLLQLAAGLRPPTAGTVLSNARRPAYAFQEPRLLPRLTVAENVNAVLSDRPETMPRALEMLEAVGLREAADKLPWQLSGGMAQRANLARALVYEGDMLLLDEPLKELDEARREDILSLLERHAAGRTLLVTTHDLRAARMLAERIYVWQDGTFVQTK